MHRIAHLCRERTSLQRLAGKLSAAEYERKSELDGLIGNAPRTQRSVRPECRQATRTGAQIARGCAWLGRAAAHKEVFPVLPTQRRVTWTPEKPSGGRSPAADVADEVLAG